MSSVKYCNKIVFWKNCILRKKEKDEEDKIAKGIQKCITKRKFQGLLKENCL